MTTLPEPVKTDSRTCFGLAYFDVESDADAYARMVTERGDTYNGGFLHGMACGREKGWDHNDPKLGRLYAVSVR